MIRFFCLILTITMFLSGVAVAKETTELNVSDWSTLPILHTGRIKPLDSFARITLKSFSGKEHINHLNASEWLALSLFNPAKAIELPVFKIRDGERYNLPKRDNRLYSYTELSKVIQDHQSIISSLIETNKERWSSDQTDLINHYEHYILYTQILRSLSFLLPISTTDDNKNFLDYKKIQRDLNYKTKNIVQQKGTNLDLYTDEEREISFLSYQLKVIEQSANHNILFRIIPENWNDKDTEWHSPWAILREGKSSPKSAEYIGFWHDMASAHRSNNIKKWKESVVKAKENFNILSLKIEKIYNTLHLLHLAFIFYIISFFLMVITNLYPIKTIKKLSTILFASGIIAHIAHISLRVYILDRPPVGTLYESILFVSLICVIGFAYLGRRQKNNSGILLGSLSGIILLTTAQGFVGEDTMSTLVAVLNTNFWLATHVLCITIGYGTCLIASLMAHYDLVLRWRKPDQTDFSKHSFHNLKIMILLSLLFTTIGTILGGIWADQSWGRFWGWDPKENGALLIVLWLAWLLHGRISKHISDLGFIVGSAFLSVIVVLAWFGVNLLNVGLHSYGFISGIATALVLFCTFEAILITTLWYLGKQQRHTA